ncbi:MAG: hypothetical protein CVT98_02520, partial [Bacteroidetes bacterium HGW-Bacteroidetes-15]
MKLLPYIKILCIAIILVAMVSCNFNSKFYHPRKINPPQYTTITSAENGDTLYTMHLLADSLPPIFIDSKNDTIAIDYGIENVLFNSKSGNMLHGWFITPNDSITPKITLLFLHGNGGNIVSYLSFVF